MNDNNEIQHIKMWMHSTTAAATDSGD